MEKLSEIITRLKLETDKNSLHSYCDHFYETALAEYRNQPIELTEIGINEGGSLLMWANWFSNCRVTGVDLMLRGNCAADCAQYTNITLKLGNAYTPDMLSQIPQSDIIIDDGPHTLESQVWAVKYLSMKIKRGGMLIIEDVADANWISQLKAVTPYHLQAYTNVIDLRPIKNRWDDLMYVIKAPK